MKPETPLATPDPSPPQPATTQPTLGPEPAPTSPPAKQPMMLIWVVAALVVVAAAIATYVLLFNKPADTAKTVVPTSSQTTHNTKIDAILQGVDYELLDMSLGSACSHDRAVCYSGETALVKLKYPVPPTFKKVVANLDKNKWLRDDGDTTGSYLESETAAGDSSFTDKQLLFTEPGADKSYEYYSFLNPSLFGKHETLYSGDYGAYLFAFSRREVQTNEQPYYILESEVPVTTPYDFAGLLAKIDDNSFILSIMVGPKDVAQQ